MVAQNFEGVVSKDNFIKGFEKVKEKLKKLEEERNKNTISPEFKAKIESKIKENLELANKEKELG